MLAPTRVDSSPGVGAEKSPERCAIALRRRGDGRGTAADGAAEEGGAAATRGWARIDCRNLDGGEARGVRGVGDGAELRAAVNAERGYPGAPEADDDGAAKSEALLGWSPPALWLVLVLVLKTGVVLTSEKVVVRRGTGT
jgi:hypothetical protein